MDSFPENSPLAALVLIWDHVETLLEEHPFLPLSMLVIPTYFIVFGNTVDFFLTWVFFCWLDLEHLEPRRLVFLGGSSSILMVLAVMFITYEAIVLSTVLASYLGHSSTGSARPHLVPCRTTHTRLLPEEHSFSNSQLLVGIAVEPKGTVNGMMSLGTSKRLSGLLPFGSPRLWYNIDPADHLGRGDGHLGLRGKLDRYLTSQVWKILNPPLKARD